MPIGETIRIARPQKKSGLSPKLMRETRKPRCFGSPRYRHLAEIHEGLPGDEPGASDPGDRPEDVQDALDLLFKDFLLLFLGILGVGRH